jgi:hypothetical protein
MGVTWVAEGISWYTEAGKNDDTVLFMVFRIFDLINCAQGIIILIIHLMKRKHLADLRRRLQRLIQQWPLKKKFGVYFVVYFLLE